MGDIAIALLQVEKIKRSIDSPPHRESSPFLWCGNQRSGSWLHLQKIVNVYKIDVCLHFPTCFQLCRWLLDLTIY